MRKKVTIKDIGRALGVNQSTVSRAMKPSTAHMITPELVKKITSKAQELGYFPNRMATALVQQRSFTVGMLVPDVTNPVFPPIIRGLEDVLDANGYTLLVINSDNKEDHEKTAFYKLRENAVDGCVMATAHRQDEVVDECLAQHIPLVLVNRMTDRQDVNIVANDDESGISDTVSYLVGLGHKNIAHIAGPQNTSTGFIRLKAFKAAMKIAGLEHSQIAIGKGFTETAGFEAMKKILKRYPGVTAVVVANDLMALGALDAMQAEGYSCPEDISITGYNNIPLIDRIVPSLTTIGIAQYQIGYRAGETLLKQLTNNNSETTVIKLKPELIIRASTAPPPLN